MFEHVTNFSESCQQLRQLADLMERRGHIQQEMDATQHSLVEIQTRLDQADAEAVGLCAAVKEWIANDHDHSAPAVSDDAVV